MGGGFLANLQLASVNAPDPTEKTVFELITTSVRHQSLNVLPILAMLVDQPDQLQVFLDCPLAGVDARLEVVLVVVLQLFVVAVFIIFTITWEIF